MSDDKVLITLTGGVNANVPIPVYISEPLKSIIGSVTLASTLITSLEKLLLIRFAAQPIKEIFITGSKVFHETQIEMAAIHDDAQRKIERIHDERDAAIDEIRLDIRIRLLETTFDLCTNAIEKARRNEGRHDDKYVQELIGRLEGVFYDEMANASVKWRN